MANSFRPTWRDAGRNRSTMLCARIILIGCSCRLVSKRAVLSAISVDSMQLGRRLGGGTTRQYYFRYMSIARFSLVALDCPDPVALCSFYQQLAGGTIKPQIDSLSEEWMRLEMPDGAAIGFQRDDNYVAPDWPDGAAQQAHLDFDVIDLDAAEVQTLAIGARKAETQPSPNEWRVFLDPAGHPFCLVKI
jgi:Glyoxalase-like domain